MRTTRTVSFVLDDDYCAFLLEYGRRQGWPVSKCIRTIVEDFAKTHSEVQRKAG